MTTRLTVIKGAIKPSLDYIRDESKTTPLWAEDRTGCLEDTAGLYGYVTGGSDTLVSGYLCDPKTAETEFAATRNYYARKGDLDSVPSASEVSCYHLVQSFPADLNISNEEVHALGCELAARLKEVDGYSYPAVIASHVNPVLGKDGQYRGKQKHNHIIFSAVKAIDEDDGSAQIKFHRTTETTRKIMELNDIIAVEHGLPIISRIKPERLYDWSKPYGWDNRHWIDRVKKDIDDVRACSANEREYISRMSAMGYSLISSGDDTIYVCPDRKHRIISGALGTAYSMVGVKRYLEDKARLSRTVSPLPDLMAEYPEGLYVRVPVGDRTVKVSLTEGGLDKDTAESYLRCGQSCEITDGTDTVLYRAMPEEVLGLLEDEEEQQEQSVPAAKNEIADMIAKISAGTLDDISPRYRDFFYDEDGSKKSQLELLYIYASLIIGRATGIGNRYTDMARALAMQRAEQSVDAGYDKRLQMIADGLSAVRVYGIKTEDELQEHIKTATADYQAKRKACQRNQTYVAGKADLYSAAGKFLDPETAETDKEQALNLLTERRAAICKDESLTPDRVQDWAAGYERIKAGLPQEEKALEKSKTDLLQLKRAGWVCDEIKSLRMFEGCTLPAQAEGRSTGKPQEK